MILCFWVQVVVIMRANMEKVLERDEKLTELDNRAGNIQNLFMTLTNVWLLYLIKSQFNWCISTYGINNCLALSLQWQVGLKQASKKVSKYQLEVRNFD